jgi:hypothetical protein
MRRLQSLGGVFFGVTAGLILAALYFGQPKPAGAASNDRYEDYIMCTGAVSINPRVQTDGLWLLDYRSGKLLGTVVDKTTGKIVGFAEVDLTAEFGLVAKQDVHFLMTTGHITQGQSALYLAETSTGKFGVYTMGPGNNGMGIAIRRHDLTSFRQVAAPAAATPAAPINAGPPLAVPPAPAPANPAVTPPAPPEKN